MTKESEVEERGGLPETTKPDGSTRSEEHEQVHIDNCRRHRQEAEHGGGGHQS